MKRASILISAVLLFVTAGVQTAMAQKVTLYSAGSKAYECDIAQLDSIVFSETQTIPTEEIVVTVDANGNADGGHQFTRLDETTFLIDGLKYKYESGDLTVIGYDPVFFSGSAIIISKLIYNGRSMDVVSIGDNVFSECSSLTSITIPNSVTSIGLGALCWCSSLTSITIPESVTRIGGHVFRGCNSLISVTIPESVTSISEYTFCGCSSLTSITIPNSVTSIGDWAFRECTSQTSITIPNSVTSIGYGAFTSCTSLTSIIVENDNTVYDSRNNCNAIIETSTNTLIAGCMNTVIPESVTSIGERAFDSCSSLTSITIPNSVTSIGLGAFCWCSSLTSITIPESVTRIGGQAFSYCRSLSFVTIGNNVTSIGDHAFEGCSSLTSITIPESVTSIGGYAFYYCTSLTNVYCYAENPPSTNFSFRNTDISSATLHVPAGSVSAYGAKSPWNQFRTIVAIE